MPSDKAMAWIPPLASKALQPREQLAIKVGSTVASGAYTLFFWVSPWIVKGPARPRGTCANPTRFSTLMFWAVFCVLSPAMLGKCDTGDVDTASSFGCFISVLVLLAVMGLKGDSVDDMVLTRCFYSAKTRFDFGCFWEDAPRNIYTEKTKLGRKFDRNFQTMSICWQHWIWVGTVSDNCPALELRFSAPRLTVVQGTCSQQRAIHVDIKIQSRMHEHSANDRRRRAPGKPPH
jgi:hypothetical protein